MTTSNLFAGLRDAKTFDKNPHLRPGQYKIRVTRGIFKKTRSKGDAFILEFKVEESNYEQKKREALSALAGGPVDLQALDKTLPNQAGSAASWYQSLKDTDIGFGALKRFCADILGVEPNDQEFIDQVEGFMNAIVADGAINGMLIPVEVATIQTKEGKDFGLHKWGKIVQAAA